MSGIKLRRRTTAKILLVEDDQDLVSRLKDWFTAEKHMVETASNGEDGLQLLIKGEFNGK